VKLSNNIRTVIIVQARMSATRLPGKILKKVLGKTLLEYQIERLNNVKNVDDIVIATTVKPIDDPVVDLCNKLNCQFFRGSELDVLSRYFEAATKFKAECIVRINADCPLIDPNVVENVVNRYINNIPQYDYVSNILEPSYPIGLHTEVFSYSALERANSNSTDPVEREHVTPYIYRNKNIFKIDSVVMNVDLSHYRWTVDYYADFKLIKTIIENVYPVNNKFDMFDIVNYMESNTSLFNINSDFTKKQIL
jgi:spore coat polysaccharide biosynthesis protein SpsF